MTNDIVKIISNIVEFCKKYNFPIRQVRGKLSIRLFSSLRDDIIEKRKALNINAKDFSNMLGKNQFWLHNIEGGKASSIALEDIASIYLLLMKDKSADEISRHILSIYKDSVDPDEKTKKEVVYTWNRDILPHGYKYTTDITAAISNLVSYIEEVPHIYDNYPGKKNEDFEKQHEEFIHYLIDGINTLALNFKHNPLLAMKQIHIPLYEITDPITITNQSSRTQKSMYLNTSRKLDRLNTSLHEDISHLQSLKDKDNQEKKAELQQKLKTSKLNIIKGMIDAVDQGIKYHMFTSGEVAGEMMSIVLALNPLTDLSYLEEKIKTPNITIRDLSSILATIIDSYNLLAVKYGADLYTGVL